MANGLGHGFLEAVYQKALAHELMLGDLKVAREVVFHIVYKGREVGTYLADMVVADRMIVELKAIDALTAAHVGQCLNYLRASNLSTGLLINFGRPKIEFRRVTL